MQVFDLLARLGQRSVVADDLVSDRQALIAAGLGRNYSPGLLFALRVASQEPTTRTRSMACFIGDSTSSGTTINW